MGFSALRIVVCGLAAAFVMAGAAADVPPAKVVAVNRAVTVVSGGHEADATVGGTVAEGSMVQTAAGNTAKLRLPDGTLLEVEQGTHFAVERFASGESEGRIRLLSGTIRLDAPVKSGSETAAYDVVTAQARVVFRREKGYVTSSTDQDVVTCLRCRVYDAAECTRNDYTVRDASTCLSLHDASVAIVTRDHGIQLEASSPEAMVRTVVGQLGGSLAAAGSGEPWWKGKAGSGTLAIEPAQVALQRPGDRAKLRAAPEPDSGDIWWMSADPKVAVVDDIDPAGTCHLHAAATGHTAIVAFDQLGRVAAVPIDVRASGGT